MANIDPAWCRELLPAARLLARRYGVASADDLAQEALVVTLEAIRAGRIATRDEAGAFMYGVCKNLVRADARTTARRAELLDRNAAMFVGATEPAPIVDLERLLACLNLLTARSRSVVLRSFVDEQEASEIADGLDLSMENVRVIRYRALLALRECMTEAR